MKQDLEQANQTGSRTPGPKHVVVLPHPSPRNNVFLKKNAWFEKETLPLLRSRVGAALA